MIVMSIILLGSIILIFIHYLKYQKKIKVFIESILKMKFFLEFLNNKSIKKRRSLSSKNVENQDINIISNNVKKRRSSKKSIFFKNNKNIKAPPIKNKNSKKINKTEFNKSNNTNRFFLDNRKGLHLGNKQEDNNDPIKNYLKKRGKKSQNLKTVNIKKCSTSSIYLSSNLIQKNWIEEFKSLKSYTFIKKEQLNDEELNTLEYNLAIKRDKRSYFQYYCSLLKKKDLILFTFCPMEDYNLLPIKISLFLIFFSLNLVINGFFFSDETMHKIYIDKGASNILHRIAEIIYSSIISGIIKIILKSLSLSETKILEIKRQKNLKNAIIE